MRSVKSDSSSLRHSHAKLPAPPSMLPCC
jgi:hypothetical protein